MDIQKPTIRSSSMPMLMTCTPSILNPDGLQVVETEIEAATVGHLVHAEAERLVAKGTFSLDTAKQRLSPQDHARAEKLLNNFFDVWKEAREYMKAPKTEWAFSVELSHIILTGHIDVHSVEAKRAFILDYKTGRQHEDHYHQVISYAFGVWATLGRPDDFTVYVSTVYLEDKSIKTNTFTAEALRDWEREVAAKVLDLRYVVGRKCAFCTLQGGCPAYREFTAGALPLLTSDAAVAWDKMTPEERGELADRMYVIEKAIDRIKLSLRNRVRSRGAIDVGGGKEFTLVTETERQIRPAVALPVLKEWLGDDAVIRNIRLPLDAILMEAAAQAPKGSKQKARQALLTVLEEKKAIAVSKTTKMYRRPIGEQQMEES